MKNIILLYALLLVMTSLPAQDRTPVYVHGNNDDAEQWQHWQALFTAERRMLAGNNQWYNSDNGVAAMGNQAAVQLNNTPFNRTIVFGHSMGGVVGRHIDLTNPAAAGQVGGYITAGSPFDGARIANNVINGNAANFITNGLDKVLKGPTREYSPTVALVYAINGNLVRMLANDHINTLLENNGQVTQATNDLAEGSAYMNSGVRTANSAIPRVHIYGNENSPVLWRIMSASIGETDNYFVNIAATAASVYNAQKWTNISLGFLGGHHFWVADGWADGANWFDGGAETGWNDLIGASIPWSTTVTYTHLDYNQYWDCMNDSRLDGWSEYEKSVHCEQQEQMWITETFTFYSPVNGQSDGFIKAPSQTGYFSAWSLGALKIEAPGVNHLEMDNHPVMLNIYNGIFDGTIPGVHPFFITPRR